MIGVIGSALRIEPNTESDVAELSPSDLRELLSIVVFTPTVNQLFTLYSALI